MNQRDRDWIHAEIREEKEARRADLSAVRQEAGVAIVVGVCGYCGGPLLAGRYHPDRWEPPVRRTSPDPVLYCGRCKARAFLSASMEERRKQPRPEVKPGAPGATS